MAKFIGFIGYLETKDNGNGIFIPITVEREANGDLLNNNTKRDPSTDSINDDLRLNHTVSVIMDDYAMENFEKIKYVKFLMPRISGLWNVTDIKVNWPRMNLSVGGIYNGTAYRPSN